MKKQDLGNGWYADIGQEYPVEVWAFSVYHDDENDPAYETGWWSDRTLLRGFVGQEQWERLRTLGTGGTGGTGGTQVDPDFSGSEDSYGQ